MNRKLQQTLSMLLMVTLMLNIGAAPGFASLDEGQHISPVEASGNGIPMGAGSHAEEMVSVVEANEAAPPKNEEPMARNASLLGDSTAELPAFNEIKNIVYANGTPVVIKEDTDRETYLYDATGSTKYLDGAPITGLDIYGGCATETTEVGDTSIVMESGTVKYLIGGDLYSNRTGDTHVVVHGGTVGAVAGGSNGYEYGYNCGQIEGNTNVTINGATGQINEIFGGGLRGSTIVSGTCSVTVGSVSVGAVYGGCADTGAVGNTDVVIDGATIADSAWGGGKNGPNEAIDTKVTFNNGIAGWVYGGGLDSELRDTKVIINGGTITGTVFGAGDSGTSWTENTDVEINGGNIAYLYGGSWEGSVTGDVKISINEPFKPSPGYLIMYGGGNDGPVDGNVVIDLNTRINGAVSAGGYKSGYPVYGTSTINLNGYATGTDDHFFPMLRGQSPLYTGEERHVVGETRLNFNNSPSDMEAFTLLYTHVKDWDEVVLDHSKIGVDSTRAASNQELAMANLTVPTDSSLFVGQGGLTIGGNLTGGGAIAIEQGNILEILGSVTGVSEVKLLADSDGAIPGNVKIISGPSCDLTQFNLTEPADYILVKENDGIYAQDPKALPINLSLSKSAPVYGDTLTATTTVASGAAGVTTSGKMTLAIIGANQQELYKKIINVDAQNKAVFNDIPLLPVANYKVNASFSEDNLAGNAAQNFTIAKRKLTITGDLPVYEKIHNGNVDVDVPIEVFKNADLTGYISTDSGGQIDVSSNYTVLYRTKDATVGQNKVATPGGNEIRLQTYNTATNLEQEKANYIAQNYYIESPQRLLVTIKPIVLKDEEFRFGHTIARHPYGDQLYSVILQSESVAASSDYGAFYWVDGSVKPPVGTNYYPAEFVPKTGVRYDYSQITGYNSETGTVVQDVKVTTAKATKPADLTYNKLYPVTVASQEQYIDLSDQNPFVATKEDAGMLTYSYTGSDTATNLSNIAFDDQSKILSFTMAAVSDETENMAIIPIKVSSENYADAYVNVVISVIDKTEVKISGISVDGLTDGKRRYDGEIATYSGTPNVTEDYSGTLEYLWYKGDILLDGAPKDVGDYRLVVQIPAGEPNFAGKTEIAFSILVGILSISAERATIFRGDDAPAFSFTADGLVAGETVEVNYTCDYVKDDPEKGKAGTYRITPRGAVVSGGSENYIIGYHFALLTVKEPYTVRFVTNGGSEMNDQRLAKGDLVLNPGDPTKSGYLFRGWFRDAACTKPWNLFSDTITGDLTLYAKWGPESSGGSSSGNEAPPETSILSHVTPGQITLTPQVDDNGNATATVSEEEITEAIKQAQDEAEKNGTTKDGIAITIQLKSEKTINSFKVNLPKGVQEKLINAGVTSFTINGGATIAFDLAAIKAIEATANADVNVIAHKVESSKLSARAKNATAGRSVYEFKVTWGDKIMTTFGEGKIVLGIPYALQKVDESGQPSATGSLENPGNLVGVYIDANDEPTYLTDFSYNEASKMMQINTDHLSLYGVGYKSNAPIFTDTINHWAKDDIAFVAARGLLTGTGNNQFSPDNAMTRGMFVTALGRMVGIDANNYQSSSFIDVAIGSYYQPYAQWAVANNIVTGTSATTFSPDRAITREEMAVMVANYARATGYKLPNIREEMVFTDNAKISVWAQSAVKEIQMAGILYGKDGGKFDPQGTTTRAEASAILRRYVTLEANTETAKD